MKATLFSKTGEKLSSLDLPVVFGTKIREDIVLKYFEAEKFILAQPYSHGPESGKRHSASGTISHQRHDWKGHYGKGISRVPRKTMWRRGTQFYWVGAEVSGMRGGRRAHGPTLVKKLRKINKKEAEFAFNSAFAATINPILIAKRYSSISKVDSPAVIESLPVKAKELFSALKKIFPNTFSLVLKKKVIRAGKGKSRGRKYKSNAGLLIIISSDEKAKFSGIDIKSQDSLLISDLYPLGRLVLYTKKAIEDMSKPSKEKQEIKK